MITGSTDWTLGNNSTNTTYSMQSIKRKIMKYYFIFFMVCDVPSVIVIGFNLDF